MKKFIQLGKEFGLEGKELLEFVQQQQKLGEERWRLEKDEKFIQEEKEEKRTREEEEKKERRKREEKEKEERRRREEEDKEERRRRQDEEREARRQEREIRKLIKEAELLRQKEAVEAARREHELELARLATLNANGRPAERDDRAKAPKLPAFAIHDLDAYLQRFERFAATAKWHKTSWASKLIALLSGRALEVYLRLSEGAASDYDRVKIALMKRYDLTEDGYRFKFIASKPEVDESPDQFIVQLDRYLLRCVFDL